MRNGIENIQVDFVAIDALVKASPRAVDYPEGRVLDCGCTVYSRMSVMNTSSGTARPDCYDEMSEG